MANDNEEVKVIPRLYPAKARKDIKNVNDIVCSIQNAFAEDAKNYFDKLYINWTSPTALDFYGRSINILTTINNKIKEFNEGNVQEMVDAFNRIAPSHRESYISVATGSYSDVQIQKLREKDSSGKVGMVDKLVESSTKEFLAQIRNLKNRTSSIPNTIHFYDTDGRLAGSCSTKVSELRNILDSTYTKILATIGNEADDAVTKVRQAIASATSILK